MNNLHYVTTSALVALSVQPLLLQQQLIESQQQTIALQAQLIESQQQVIALQNRVDSMTPKNAADDEILWHVASGMFSSDAAQSEDIETVRRFQDWLITFAEQHIQPYVNPRVYMEMLSQMTRGLPERIAKLETKKDIDKFLSMEKSPVTGERIIQLALKES